MDGEKKQVPIRIQWGDSIGQIWVDESFDSAPFDAVQLRIAAEGEDGKEKWTEVEVLTLISTAEKDERIQRLLFEGGDTKTIMLGNKVPVVFRTSSGKETLENDTMPEGVKPPKNAIPKWYTDYETVATLAYAIESWDGAPIGDTREEKEDFIAKLPDVTLAYLAQEWTKYMRELRDLLRPDVIGDMVKKS